MVSLLFLSLFVCVFTNPDPDDIHIHLHGVGNEKARAVEKHGLYYAKSDKLFRLK